MDLVDFFEKFIKIVTRYWDVFLIKGLSTTLALSAIAVFFGAIIGTLLAFGKMGKSRILRGIITAYVEIIRGTPSLLQVYVGYFVVPLLLPSLNVSTYASVAIALTINSSAYVSEVIRSGIQAVDKGQTEAARSLGLTQSQAMIKVVLPQAVKNILPALGTHEPVSEAQWNVMFAGIPYDAMLVHDWRHDVVKIGEVPAAYLEEITEGLWHEPVSVEINRRIMDERYDLIVSPGQVVPHEVIGMANHSKNLFVGVGGSDMINKSHMVGAVYGMERMMGKDDTPVRKIFCSNCSLESLYL